MAIPVRRPRRPRPGRPEGTRTGATLRDTVLAVGLVAIVLCGTGMTARAAIGDAADVPAVILALLVAGAMVAVLARAGRRRRAAPGTALLAAAPAPVAPAPTLVPPGRPQEPTEPTEPPEVGEVQEVPEEYAGIDYAALDPYSFEQTVADLCVRDGCADVEVVGGAGDLGADVLATTPDGRRVVLQCKAYGTGNKVGSQDLQRFGGTCFAVHDAQVAAVVTTSEFTAPADEYAARCGILCMDRTGLDAWAQGIGPAPWLLPPPTAPED
ncbi:restriction endonuclease [Streptomyces lichenis]|uniref:Restriction endonuclease n=1 Tax=Streptomyces lichenis TaxID=2306967 RepID=A0ABT0IJV2_9ACTN|nr:restriction endonuclease [Streptomyces lichenis]MCK8681613.1 restriction endonuclease [Streptomyces lichenis]